jgi:ubiquinone/menaquinone biosynthesis C-methylase UbiE
MSERMTADDAAYDDVADAYHQAVDPDGTGLHDATLDELVGEVEVAGRRVLALACGQGRDARLLADLGASVVGVDASARMLAHARRLEDAKPRGIAYVHGNAHSLSDLGDGSFDGVVCHMALMDIPELEPTLAAVARVLRPGSWFVFSIVHPCYKAPAAGELVDHVDGSVRRTVGRYFEEGPFDSVTRWDVLPRRAYLRMLSTYVNALVAAGLLIVRMVEPVGDRPVWQTVPGLLYARCQKAAVAATAATA